MLGILGPHAAPTRTTTANSTAQLTPALSSFSFFLPVTPAFLASHARQFGGIVSLFSILPVMFLADVVIVLVCTGGKSELQVCQLHSPMIKSHTDFFFSCFCRWLGQT